MRFTNWRLLFDYEVEIIKGSSCSWHDKVDGTGGGAGGREREEKSFGILCCLIVTISKIIKRKNEIALIIIAVPNNVDGSRSPL